eukprot:gene2119-2438_t
MAAARYKMISIPEATATVLQHTPVLDTEVVPLSSGLGRILAETDGYAVVAADGVGEYPVIGESRAGYMDDMTVTSGTVAYITTAVATKPSSNAVSLVTENALHAILPSPVRERAGQAVLEAGERVGVAEIGILATVGAAALPVRRRPRLAVLSTGDEVLIKGLLMFPTPGLDLDVCLAD